MATTYTSIGHGGADTWREAVATASALPGTGMLGEVRFVIDVEEIYYWDGAAWQVASASSSVSSIADLTAVTNGAAATAGDIGEVITASQALTGTGVAATGVYGNVTTVSLTAGIWEVDGVVQFSENGANLTTSLSSGVSTATNGSTLGAFDACIHNNIISSTSDLIVPVPKILVSIAGTTSYYLNTRFYYTSGSPQHGGKITARRIR